MRRLSEDRGNHKPEKLGPGLLLNDQVRWRFIVVAFEVSFLEKIDVIDVVRQRAFSMLRVNYVVFLATLRQALCRSSWC